MSKDHLASPTPSECGLTHVPLEWLDGKPKHVPVVMPHYHFDEAGEDEIAEARQETARAVVSFILDSERPGMTAWQLAFACGLCIPGGLAMPEVAARHGVSKQDFQQGVEKIRGELGLRQARNMRGEEAREEMRLRNSRRG